MCTKLCQHPRYLIIMNIAHFIEKIEKRCIKIIVLHLLMGEINAVVEECQITGYNGPANRRGGVSGH